MRKLLWFSIGFTSACALSAYYILGNAFLPVGIGLLVISLIGVYLKGNEICSRIAVVLLGCALGLLWYQIYDHAYLSLPRSLDGETVITSVRATDYSFDTGYGMGVDGQITINDHTYKVRAYFEEGQLTPGCVIHGEFQLCYTPPGGQNEPTYLRGQGIFLMAYEQEKSTIVQAAAKSWRYAPAYLRQEILSLLDRMLSPETAPFAKALLIGDTTDLDYHTQTHLSLSGIRHVAAVSGLHVSVLFSMIYMLSGKKRFLTALVGLPCLFLFAAVAGFTPSIMRSCMMQGIMILAMVFNREYDPPTALAFAVVTMLAMNPHIITNVGFQLSIASVAGIFLFAGKIKNRLMGLGNLSKVNPKTWKGRLIRGITGSISVSLSVVVLTAPLTALYFGCISLIGILTNLLCLWAVTGLFCGLVASCLISILFLPVAKILCCFLEWVIHYVLGVSNLLAQFPLAAVFPESIYIVIWLIFSYILLGVFMVTKNKRPVILLCCTVVGLCIALLASWSEPLLDNYRITALDVGQGQCILLQSGRKTYMVDCGGDREEDAANKAAMYLQSMGIYQIDGLIVTHYDRDHVGGIPYLLERIHADVLILPAQTDQEWKTALEEKHTGQIVTAGEDLSISWNEGCITVYAAENVDSKNESSLCVLFQTKKCDILITGDRSISGEARLLQVHTLPDIEILVAGHHGDKDATGELLLTVTKPEVVLISVSKKNNYGHPSKETLVRLESHGCMIRRTDLEGIIILRG